MTLGCQCNTSTTTFCLCRKFHHVLLQNHSCVSSDRLDFSHPDVFQSQLHQTLHNIWHWSFSRSCSTGALLVPGTFPGAGFQLLVFPQESKLPRQEQNFLSHLVYPHQYLNSSLQSVKASGLIHLNHSWYLFSMGVNEILGTVAAMGWVQPQGLPNSTSSMMVPVSAETGASWDASCRLSCLFAKGAGFINCFSYSTWGVGKGFVVGT